MDSIGRFAPTSYVLFAEQAWNTGLTKSIRTRRGALSYDETGRCPLTVVGSHQVIWYVADGTAPGHWRHHDAVLEREAA